MELDLQSLFGWDPATPPLPPHLISYTRALLVSQDRRHLYTNPLIVALVTGILSLWTCNIRLTFMWFFATKRLSLMRCSCLWCGRGFPQGWCSWSRGSSWRSSCPPGGSGFRAWAADPPWTGSWRSCPPPPRSRCWTGLPEKGTIVGDIG